VDEEYSNVNFNSLPEASRTCQNVYDNYKTFCSKKGFKQPLSSISLGQELKRLGFERYRLGSDVKSLRNPNLIIKRPYIYKKIENKENENKFKQLEDTLNNSNIQSNIIN
jgi:hypothetical protein